ncbi:MAG: hypothetical protein IIA45_14045 [Bacteroidetes bacterium]|nr:hypothetical protein [Bacteroidota bacterium]
MKNLMVIVFAGVIMTLTIFTGSSQTNNNLQDLKSSNGNIENNLTSSDIILAPLSIEDMGGTDANYISLGSQGPLADLDIATMSLKEFEEMMAGPNVKIEIPDVNDLELKPLEVNIYNYEPNNPAVLLPSVQMIQNPEENYFDIKLSLKSPQLITIYIQDAADKPQYMAINNKTFKSGIYDIRFVTSDIPKGEYFVFISNGGNWVLKSLVIDK